MVGPRIVIAGAGSIGCYVGGLLLAGGRDVSFLVRERIAAELTRHGLHLSDLTGMQTELSPERLRLFTDPAALGEADIVLVTVKSGATRTMAELIARHAPTEAVVVSLQNGLRNAPLLREQSGPRTVLAGMVPFNVVGLGGGRYHRGTSGALVIERGPPQVRDALEVPHLAVQQAEDVDAVLWGKLILNLNNALNALSGLPLREQLLDRRWRRILADQQEEALTLLSAAGIRPWSMGPLPARALPHLLRLPTPLFRVLARSAVKIDRQARSSMWEDLERGRATEIGELQGAVVELAERLRLEAGVNRRVQELVRQAEIEGRGSPRLRPEQVARS